MKVLDNAVHHHVYKELQVFTSPVSSNTHLLDDIRTRITDAGLIVPCGVY